MAKITIYVPDKLYKEMNEYPKVNWSAAAQRAFRNIVNNTDDRKFITEIKNNLINIIDNIKHWEK